MHIECIITLRRPETFFCVISISNAVEQSCAPYTERIISRVFASAVRPSVVGGAVVIKNENKCRKYRIRDVMTPARSAVERFPANGKKFENVEKITY